MITGTHLRTTLTHTLYALAAILLLGSCVAKKKYRGMAHRADEQQKEILALNQRIAGLNDTIASLNSNLSGLQDRLGELGNENKQTAEALNMTREQVAAQRQRLRQMQDLLNQQQKSVQALRQKIAEALRGFNSDELSIRMKNGKVYISMQENLLFPSGSAQVNPKGKQALEQVANVLRTNNDINIEIEGHTDSIAIHNKLYADNWSLSVARATSIARILIDDYKVSPTRLVASGRSYYDPVNSNTTPEGRAMNRRTEIILEPKLDELLQLMSADNTASR